MTSSNSANRVMSLYEGKLNVHYGQAYIASSDRALYDSDDPLGSAFRNQSNGLCGAADRGALFLITSLHTGYVEICITLFDTAPPLELSWQEIVEVSLVITSPPVNLVDWFGHHYELQLPAGTCRVRYCADNMDEAHLVDTVQEDEEAVDSYALLL